MDGFDHARLRHLGRLQQLLRAPGDVDRLVADALQIGGHLDRGEHAAEIVRQRLKPREDVHALAVDLLLQRIHRLVVGDDPVAKRLVAAGQRARGIGQAFLGDGGHPVDAVD